MTALILIIVPFAIFIGSFLFFRFWISRQTDRLAARHRALGIFIWVVTLLMLTALILRIVAPSLAPMGSLGIFMAFSVVFASWQRRRLSRQLHEK